MSIGTKNSLRKVIWAAVPFLFAAGLFPRCANTLAPTGGPKDTLPPVVVDMNPPYGTINFDEKRIYIEFDEYVKLVDLQKEFFTSPVMEKKPTVFVKGRGIQIDMRDTLQENTTYSLNFASSVQDNNEGNPLHNLRYVFSTGDYIDSMIMSGYSVDAYTKDSVAKSFIFFYEASKDSIPAYDSTIFNARPDAVARATPNGIFLAENLKPIDYRIYAMQDNNGNQTYEPGVDRIGFLDSVYNPVDMPPFSIWYDTTRMYLVADPQLYFRMFMDDPFKRQILSGQNRPNQHLIVLNFGAHYPVIENIEFSNIDNSRIITEQLKPTGDSIAYWLNIEPENLPDTIRGQIVYLKHDSINILRPDTTNLSLFWKAFESKQDEKDREKREREREKAIEEGREPEKEPNPFKVRVEAGSNVNPEKGISFIFDFPLVKLDSTAVTLEHLGAVDTTAVNFRFERDTFNMRTWRLDAPWIEGDSYSLLIPEGAFVDAAGLSNDTLRSSFTIMDPEKFSTVTLNVIGKTDSSHYVLQILSASNQVIQERRHAVTGKYTFRFLDPGTIRIRVVEDVNQNGVWDKGNLVERRQSERVEIFYTDGGDDQLTLRVNWEIEEDIDMNRLFSPITMESVIHELQRGEALRIKRRREAEEKNAFRPPGGSQIPENNIFDQNSGIGGRVPGL